MILQRSVRKQIYVGGSTSTSTLPGVGVPNNPVRSVTFGSRTLSPVGRTISTDLRNTVELFRLVDNINPPSGTDVPITVEFESVPIAGNAFVNFAVGGSVAFNGVS